MKVRVKRSAPPETMPQAQAFSFPSPIRGLVLNENIAMVQPGGALVLDNFICTTTGIKARAGTSDHIPLGAKIQSMFVYNSGGIEAAFGATATAVYPISTGGLVTPVAVISGQTSGAYSTEQFGTAGGDYLYAVNGSDAAQLFDGAIWKPINGASTPAITGVSTSALSHVWSFANRLFFVEKGTMNAWYLPIDSIGGTANVFSLAGIFKKGGSLLFGSTWSMDAGDGLDDKCVFFSDQGEVAVYEGINPGSAADWRKAGVYNITTPLGPNATMQAGGDLLVATKIGLIPVSAAIRRDVAALEVDAVSKNITPLWQQKAFELGGGNWEIQKWPSQNIMVISQPGDTEKTCLVANLQTGAWSRFTGINVQRLAFFDNSMFFGGSDGMVRRFESGGSDSGSVYTAAYLGQYESMGMAGVQKTIAQMRATFRNSTKIAPLVSVKADYSQGLSAPPNAAPEGDGQSVWGIGKWGLSKWGGSNVVSTQAVWGAIGRTGYAIAPEVQLTFGTVSKPIVELVGIDATFHVGALVT